MPGLSYRSEGIVLNGVSAQVANAWPTSLFLALFTAVGLDDGTGFTEVTGGSYARTQIAGQLTIGTTQGSLGTTLTFSSVPSWVVAGMHITNLTRADIPANTTIVSTTSTTITLSASTTGTVATSGDVIAITTFGTANIGEPSNNFSGSAVTFPTTTAPWGTLLAWGVYDAVSSGNLVTWDFLGNFNWIPCNITNAAPAIFTAPSHGYNVSDTFVFSTEYGGVGRPVFSAGSWASIVSPLLTVLTVPTADTLTASNSVTVNTTSSGSGMIRKVVTQVVPTATIVVVPASNFSLVAA